jgi:hypothetical protein
MAVCVATTVDMVTARLKKADIASEAERLV